MTLLVWAVSRKKVLLVLGNVANERTIFQRISCDANDVETVKVKPVLCVIALGVTRGPRARRYGSLARCQQSAHRQNACMPPGWLREGGTERVQSLIEKLWNGFTEFGGKINMFHDDLFSVELQSGIALHRSSDDSSLT